MTHYAELVDRIRRRGVDAAHMRAQTPGGRAALARALYLDGVASLADAGAKALRAMPDLGAFVEELRSGGLIGSDGEPIEVAVGYFQRSFQVAEEPDEEAAWTGFAPRSDTKPLDGRDLQLAADAMVSITPLSPQGFKIIPRGGSPDAGKGAFASSVYEASAAAVVRYGRMLDTMTNAYLALDAAFNGSVSADDDLAPWLSFFRGTGGQDGTVRADLVVGPLLVVRCSKELVEAPLQGDQAAIISRVSDLLGDLAMERPAPSV